MLLTRSPDLLPYQQDNPIGQGVCILLYSHSVITIRSLAYKNLPGLNYVWLWGIYSIWIDMELSVAVWKLASQVPESLPQKETSE